MKKKSISIILLLLVVVQQALPIFEGAKQKVSGTVAKAKQKVDKVKTVILQTRDFLQKHSKCLISGKGCDAETRSGLQILKDLVSGNMAKVKVAKQKAKEFIKKASTSGKSGLEFHEARRRQDKMLSLLLVLGMIPIVVLLGATGVAAGVELFNISKRAKKI